MLMITPRIPIPAYVRARGGVRLVVGTTERGVTPLEIRETGGYRVRFPNGRACEGVLINTGGGMAGGDRMAVGVAAKPGADAVLTTQAAEKIYRSDGPEAEVAVSLALEQGSRLAWLPQEQILFDGARLRRTIELDCEEGARAILAEGLVFGRAGMLEQVRNGDLLDRWRIRRSGRLLYADTLRLQGDIAEKLASRVVAANSTALATIVVFPAGEKESEAVRAIATCCAGEVGVSAWNGLAAVRFCAQSGAELRADMAAVLKALRAPLPRLWLN